MERGTPLLPPLPPQGVPFEKFDGEFFATIKKFSQVKKIFPRPKHWYPYSYRVVSLWVLVEIVEIYQMTYRYMGVILLPNIQKLLVYTLLGIAACGTGYPPSTPLSPPPGGTPRKI